MYSNKSITISLCFYRRVTVKLSINCFLLGDDSSTVKIPRTENVSILRDLVKEKQSRRLNYVDASELTVWKVSLPVDAISPELTVGKECQKLHSLQKISSIFREALADEHVHILVQVPTGALHKHFLDSGWHFLLVSTILSSFALNHSFTSNPSNRGPNGRSS